MTFSWAGLGWPVSPHNNTPQMSLPPLLFALKNEIKDEDDDDGQHDHNSRAKPKNIFHLEHSRVYFSEKY